MLVGTRSFAVGRRLFSSGAAPFLAKPLLEGPGRCLLPKGVVRVAGGDAAKLLHGLCTGNVLEWSTAPTFTGAFVAFLTSHVLRGRMLYDAFIYKQDTNAFLLECDLAVTGDFMFHLKQYRLRNKVDIQDVTNSYAIVPTWNQSDDALDDGINVKDTRCRDWTMLRSCMPRDSPRMLSLTDNCQIYDTLRLLQGIPEGASEIIRGKAIPLEYNMDLLGATDLHKGCYMGQELVARTLHKGVIRKRVLPVRIFEWHQDRSIHEPDPTKSFAGIEPDAEMMPVEPIDALSYANVTRINSESSFGKIIRVLGNIGIALVRLPQMPPFGLFAVHRPTPSFGEPTFVLGQAFIPSWWPPNANNPESTSTQ